MNKETYDKIRKIINKMGFKYEQELLTPDQATEALIKIIDDKDKEISCWVEDLTYIRKKCIEKDARIKELEGNMIHVVIEPSAQSEQLIKSHSRQRELAQEVKALNDENEKLRTHCKPVAEHNERLKGMLEEKDKRIAELLKLYRKDADKHWQARADKNVKIKELQSENETLKDENVYLKDACSEQIIELTTLKQRASVNEIYLSIEDYVLKIDWKQRFDTMEINEKRIKQEIAEAISASIIKEQGE